MISKIMKKMVEFSDGNIRDIEHFIKVYGYAKTIGELEGLDKETQFVLELAAISHDIACPLCREKYGSTRGNLQELESPELIRHFFAGESLSAEQIERICWLVAHHHTTDNVQDIDHRILLEADYLVNAAEQNQSRDKILAAKELFFETESGKTLLDNIFLHGGL